MGLLWNVLWRLNALGQLQYTTYFDLCVSNFVEWEKYFMCPLNNGIHIFIIDIFKLRVYYSKNAGSPSNA